MSQVQTHCYFIYICKQYAILENSDILVYKCNFFFFQVKIWFQNRRMKWKRSKKAQQESKSRTESDPERNCPAPVSDEGDKRSPSDEDMTLEEEEEVSSSPFSADRHLSHHHLQCDSSSPCPSPKDAIYRPYIA